MPDADTKPKSSEHRIGKRRLTGLLFGLVALYGVLFAGIYLWKSEIDWKAIFSPGASEVADISIAGPVESAALSAESTPSVQPEILPPLDDRTPFQADDEAPFLFHPEEQTPASPTSFIDAPPPPVPGVVFSDKLVPIRCWDERGFEFSAEECDEPGRLAKFAAYRLSDWERCRTETTSETNLGSFAVFAEADFVRNTFTVWPGFASSVRFADRIADCVTEAWRSFPLDALPHRYNRYRMKGTVRFDAVRRNPNAPSTSPSALLVSSRQTEVLNAALATATEVTVARERVRVRKAPVDGEIIGFISTGQKVKLVQVTDDWCLVKTARGNVGWMICWGLDLSQKTPSSSAPPSASEKK